MTASIRYPVLVEPLAPAADETVGAPLPAWLPRQQPPVFHRRFVPPSGAVRGPDESELVAVFDATSAPPHPPQQDPVKHRRFQGYGRATGFSLSETVDQADKWAQPQQLPVPHRSYRPESRQVRGQDESEFTVAFDVANGFPYPMQLPPGRHVHYQPLPDVRSGIEVSLLEEVTQSQWRQPQQPPVPHRWYRPDSGSVNGITPSLLEFTTTSLWFQPQADPQPLRPRQVWTNQYTTGLDEDDFAGPENITLDKWFRPQQEPIKHRRHPGNTGVFAGTQPTLLEEVTRIHWVQPQSLPLPLRTRQVWLPTCTTGFESSTFTVIETVTLDKWFRPQQEPVFHRDYRPVSVVVAGAESALLEFVTRSEWRQPQQSPVPHRRPKPPIGQSIAGPYPGTLEDSVNQHWFFPQQPPVHHEPFRSPSGVISGIDASLLEFTTALYLSWPQADPQPIRKRKVWLDQYTSGFEPTTLTAAAVVSTWEVGISFARTWEVVVEFQRTDSRDVDFQRTWDLKIDQ